MSLPGSSISEGAKSYSSAAGIVNHLKGPLVPWADPA